MHHRPRALAWTAVALACSLASCGLADLAPAGSREWRINVENMSGAPAILVVAEDGATMGARVGTAMPSTVPAGVSEVVVFTVPPGDGWAIFVNPSPMHGPLILSRDVPAGAAGALPITTGIGRDGAPYVSTQAGVGPGWFGN